VAVLRIERFLTGELELDPSTVAAASIAGIEMLGGLVDLVGWAFFPVVLTHSGTLVE
jgi:hypothetical protein